MYISFKIDLLFGVTPIVCIFSFNKHSNYNYAKFHFSFPNISERMKDMVGPYMCHFLKLQASACNFTKSSTPPWVFFAFSKLYKWY